MLGDINDIFLRIGRVACRAAVVIHLRASDQVTCFIHKLVVGQVARQAHPHPVGNEQQPFQGIRLFQGVGVGEETAWLRAQRFGCGNGRVYEITFLASDGRGGETIGSVFVYVPHHRRKCEFVMPIDDGQRYDATKGWRPYWWHRKWHHWHWHGFRFCKQKGH